MKNILLIFGGKSFEHDISIITALIVKNAYREGETKLIPLYVSGDNEWFYYGGDRLTSKLFKNFKESYKKNNFYRAELGMGQIKIKKGFKNLVIKIDGALNCCHGGMGESGELCALLNLYNIPVSSGDHTGLGILMDKVKSKYVFDGLSLPNLPYSVATKSNFINDFESIKNECEKLGYPLIIKPATLGSSIGIEVAKDEQQLFEALSVAFEFDEKVLIEKAVLEGMSEYNVACLKVDNKVIVSDIDKPQRKDEILSFKDKYIGEGSGASKSGGQKSGGVSGQYLSPKKDFPAKVDSLLEEKLKATARRVYEALELFGPIRVDFICDSQNNVYLNELNTIPGSLAYYFFIPSVFKNMTEYVGAIIKQAELEFKSKNIIKKEFVTKLFDK